MIKSTQRIQPCLWFDNQAEEAANFYIGIFPNSKVLNVARYGDKGPGLKGSVMTVEFELDGEKLLALNGGPMFKFSEAISLMVNCETQEEIDHYWTRLTDGDAEVECGWLKDRYGLFWQIVPAMIGELVGGNDAARSERVMAAIFSMKKLDIATLKRAAGM